MKRFIFLTLLLALALTLTAGLASCKDSETTTPATEANTTTEAAPEVTENPLLVTAYDNPEAFVTLPALKDIQIPKANINKLVDEEIKKLLPELAKTDFKMMPSGTLAKKGDAVNINYVGRAKDPSVTLSEATIKGMSNADDKKGYDLILGSGSFIPGFEDQLIGAKEGDTVAVDLSFPENYGNAELNGLAVIFDVTVNSVKRATVEADHTLALYVTYTLNGVEANGDIATFLPQHGAKFDLTDLTKKFDDYFDAQLIANALLGKNILDEVTLDLTMSAESAKDFAYETELSLTAKIVISDIIRTPTELSDADIDTYTGGQYKTVEAFRTYLYDYYKITEIYNTITKTIVFAEIPQDVYNALYQGYYDQSLRNQIGDTSTMSPDDLAAALTDKVKETADKFAKENATAEWNDRMMMAYLKKVSGYVLTDEAYKTALKELYDYYATYQPMMLYYYGIDSVETFEKVFGKDYLTFQFENDGVLEHIASLVTYVDEAPETAQ